MVTLWTIQSEEAYRVFEKTGVLRANYEQLFCSGVLRYAYDWMVGEMCKRISPPPDGVQYPIWAWY